MADHRAGGSADQARAEDARGDQGDRAPAETARRLGGLLLVEGREGLLPDPPLGRAAVVRLLGFVWSGVRHDMDSGPGG
ncbi:hypothetical protein ACOBQX_25815 [Actinokineospora sp. G85]|uniref:hypothetical protein n=1 Tax=Actinokineospora sp. G85 TaxID=3406626 RepID=UPI003C76D671